MLDAITLDQLRTFIAALDAGSFSAAGRKLRRAQFVVGQTQTNLEAQLGVKLVLASATALFLSYWRSMLVTPNSICG